MSYFRGLKMQLLLLLVGIIVAFATRDIVPFNHFEVNPGQIKPFGTPQKSQLIARAYESCDPDSIDVDCARPCGNVCLKADQQCCEGEYGLFCNDGYNCNPLGCCPSGEACDQLPGDCIDDETSHRCGDRCIPNNFECCDETKGRFCGEGFRCGCDGCYIPEAEDPETTFPAEVPETTFSPEFTDVFTDESVDEYTSALTTSSFYTYGMPSPTPTEVTGSISISEASSEIQEPTTTASTSTAGHGDHESDHDVGDEERPSDEPQPDNVQGDSAANILGASNILVLVILGLQVQGLQIHPLLLG